MKAEKKRQLDLDQCLVLMEEELGALEKLALAQDGVRKAVLGREWVDFEKKIDELDGLGAAFEALEAERRRLFMRFIPSRKEGDEDLGFYSLIAALPREKRTAFAACFRQVKLLILRMRLANESLLRYIEEARATVAGFIDAAFPDRRGRFYGRRGEAVSPDMRSMVLNRSL
jgi:hypothetical protein